MEIVKFNDYYSVVIVIKIKVGVMAKVMAKVIAKVTVKILVRVKVNFMVCIESQLVESKLSEFMSQTTM